MIQNLAPKFHSEKSYSPKLKVALMAPIIIQTSGKINGVFWSMISYTTT